MLVAVGERAGACANPAQYAVKVLFSVSHFGFLRNFEPALYRLAAEGHSIHLLADRRESLGGVKTIENLTRAHGTRVTYAYAPGRKDDRWYHLAVQMRLCRDYWRYLEPRYRHATSLRARAAKQAPAVASIVGRMLSLGGAPARRVLHSVIRRLDSALPPSPAVVALLEKEKPDLLLITPLLYFGSSQVDYVKAARRLGIPTMLGVGSWDHLTTKGLVHAVPDRVVVWNEAQREEARTIHDIPPERLVVTGAQAYDHWFVMTPANSREAFCASHGFDPARPLLLYLCSSPFITPHEVPFVRRWIDALRASKEEDVRCLNILIRPHPQNAEQWREVDLASGGRVSIWPRAGANPVDAEARAEYFDAMYHSVAVVGVNTSALIESGIVGRPVCTIQATEFEGQQEGTLHFQHLKSVNGGLLHVAADLSQHLEQVARILEDPTGFATRSRAFIESFVRPHGLSTPAAEVFVREAVATASLRPTPPRPQGMLDSCIRAALAPLARGLHAAARRRKADKKGARAAAA
jgi:hypothetical protein